MKKKVILGLILSIFIHHIYSQITLNGIVIKKINPYQIGDTVKIIGKRTNLSLTSSFYIVNKPYGDKTVSVSKIKLLDSTTGFWEKIWFEYRGADFRFSGWEKNKREALNKYAHEFHQEAIINDMIYNDELLYDYIYQLLYLIFPSKLIKSNPSHFGLIILKSDKINYLTFNNGFIVLTTGLLAEIKNENQLIEILTKCISTIVLEHDLKNYTSISTAIYSAKSMGNLLNYRPTYNYNQKLNTSIVTNRFLTILDTSKIISKDAYLRRMSGVISYMAWEEYNKMNYIKSFLLVNKLHKHHLTTEKDYLLLSKIYRSTSYNKAMNEKSLQLIEEAKKLGITSLIDLDKECGILYLRQGDYTKANNCFNNYKKGLYELEKQGFDISTELEFVKSLQYKYKLTESSN